MASMPVLDKITIETMLMFSVMALVVSWFLGTIIGFGPLTKVGLPLTMLMLGTSIVVSWKFAKIMGTARANVIGKAPVFFGLMALIIMVGVAFYFPIAFPDAYSIVDLRLATMSLIAP